jgi:hypothetical protein
MGLFQDAFISYGRADSKYFAKQLNDRLIELGYEVWFDFDNIPLGVDYQKQINDGIEKSDNFLFIISPHAVNSPYCRLEIELALTYRKRIIPILHVEQIDRATWQQRNPHGTDTAWQLYQSKGLHSSFVNMHPEISKINWIYSREGIDSFTETIQGLKSIFHRQQAYVHRHTVLLHQASEWEQNQEQPHYLLIGEELQQAQVWLTTRFREEQPPCIPTDLHSVFITESIKHANDLMTQVFLSHAPEDDEIAERIGQSLMRRGITIWSRQRDVEVGVNTKQAIMRGIEEADNMVYLLSPHSGQCEFCQKELGYASYLNKRIIPLKLAEFDPDKVPTEIQELQYIDLTDNILEEDYLKDESQLLRILNQDPSYYQQHKVLLAGALKWERQDYNRCTLLRSHSLEKAKAWLKIA